MVFGCYVTYDVNKVCPLSASVHARYQEKSLGESTKRWACGSVFFLNQQDVIHGVWHFSPILRAPQGDLHVLCNLVFDIGPEWEHALLP